MAGWVSKIVCEFFEYDTPKIVHIKSRLVGVLNRLIQAGIIAYICGYVIYYKKGYQEFSEIDSSVTAKLKGVVYTNFSNDELQVPPEYKYIYQNRVWDVADYVVPPQENGAFYVMTNMVVTPGQKQEVCLEDPLLAPCDPGNNTCVADQPVTNGNGVMTGRCLTNKVGKNASCEIHAWCPVEQDILPLGTNRSVLQDSKNFTVLIKNNIEFPLFKIRRRNVLDSDNKTYLQSCNYDPHTDPSCPIFKLGTIVEQAGENYDILAVEGGVIGIVISWDCNLDYGLDRCIPKYSFRRLDNPHAQIARGWNFRFAQYYNDGIRTLTKAYGIRFVVFVQGQGGKFNIVPLMLNVGSGLGLLALTTIICDVIVLYVLKRKNYYKEKKFLNVEDIPYEELQEDTAPAGVQ